MIIFRHTINYLKEEKTPDIAISLFIARSYETALTGQVTRRHFKRPAFAEANTRKSQGSRSATDFRTQDSNMKIIVAIGSVADVTCSILIGLKYG
jgi:hypothetical protein